VRRLRACVVNYEDLVLPNEAQLLRTRLVLDFEHWVRLTWLDKASEIAHLDLALALHNE
jgi:hypothetical protein